jgi:ABC-type glutathione transport system ATPase component
MRLLETSVMIYMKMKFWGGESGSGLFHLAIMGLLPAHISKISEGSIVFQGNNVAKLKRNCSAEMKSDFSGADELSESIAKMWRSSAGNLLQHTNYLAKKQRQKHFFII